MIISFLGDNEFITKRKLKDTVDKYKNKHKSGLNLFYFSGEDFSFDDFENATKTASMFYEKKCIVVKEFFSKAKEKDIDNVKKYIKDKKIKESDDVFLLFAEFCDIPKKDKNLKWISDNSAFLYKSDNFSESQLKSWIKKEAESYGAKIDKRVIDLFLIYFKGDLFKISNEIKKLASYTKNISEKEFYALSHTNKEGDIFKAIDFLLSGKKDMAIDFFYRQIKEGKSFSYILSMINFQFRNLIKLKALLDDGVLERDLAKRSKLHPFVVKKSLGFLKRYTKDDLKKIYNLMLKTDTKIKTTSIDDGVLVDRLIFKI